MKKLVLLTAFLVSVLCTHAQQTDTTYVQVEGTSLHCVLSKEASSTASPLVIIVAGSGPTDLNGNQPGMQNNSLRLLSEALVSKGISTLRFDKRAIAKSAYADFKEEDLNIDQYANDLTKLIKHAGQKGFTDIYVAGHSEGSLLALLAIQKVKVKGFVSIAGAGRSADLILKEQLKPKLPPEFYLKVELIIDSLKMGELVKNTPPELNALFRASVQPYLISWFKYSPSDLIANLTCPILILQGDKDIQVGLEDANKLKAASSNAELVVVNNMNHVLKTIEMGMQENIASYTNPILPVNTDLVEAIANFIKE
ncbi:alpha/beta hydrolase family protein [Labilibaculum antarcticum]|uniref:Alpha/beta hydrolase n=1 Tax=Labilibaculum antarcticum TaxID=1717717 RepID=A0A1Y1CPP8_9BACT|nr:alpha/beta fold hydrolase [Labilibaculum antarcticum]BAX81973.1 alpha/beta hydrolase [Labilibaculum antarcticum]